MIRSLRSLALPALLVLALVACKKEEGPAEKMGKQIDQSMEQAGEKMQEGMEKAGEEMQKVGEAMQGHDDHGH